MDRYRVKPNEKIKLEKLDPADRSAYEGDKEKAQEDLAKLNDKLEEYQERVAQMYAWNRQSLIGMLLSADSLQGFFTTLRFMKLVTEADEQALVELEEASVLADQLAYDAEDDVWQGTFTVASGPQEYKAALNNTWDNSFPSGNVALTGAGNPVKFYYDHKTHFVSDSTKLIIVAVGNWQQEVGCSGNWAPDCLRGWMTDVDNDGTYTCLLYTSDAADDLPC